jgi:hypothetical protein
MLKACPGLQIILCLLSYQKIGGPEGSKVFHCGVTNTAVMSALLGRGPHRHSVYASCLGFAITEHDLQNRLYT